MLGLSKSNHLYSNISLFGGFPGRTQRVGELFYNLPL